MLEANQYGLLPPGIHEMSLEEIGRFFGNVEAPPHRRRLFEKLTKYVKRLRALQVGVALLVDGSFVMPHVEIPNDIDLILVMPADRLQVCLVHKP